MGISVGSSSACELLYVHMSGALKVFHAGSFCLEIDLYHVDSLFAHNRITFGGNSRLDTFTDFCTADTCNSDYTCNMVLSGNLLNRKGIT